MASPKRGRRGSVTFGKQTVVYDDGGFSEGGHDATLSRQESVFAGDEPPHSGWWGRGCRALVEKRPFRVFYRVCALLNVLSLLFSAPLLVCTSREHDVNDCYGVFVQFTFIACVDFVLCVVYTLQTAVRLHYAVHLYQKAPQHDYQFGSEKKKDFRGYISPLRLLNLSAITASLWWSFFIGIYRSMRVQPYATAMTESEMESSPVLIWAWYLPFVPRSLAIFSSIKLVVHLRLPSSALLDFLKKIKWKQLGFVTLFYLFFIYLYALFGVHWIGALSERCYSPAPDGDMMLAIPVTHCTLSANGSGIRNCFSNDGTNEGIACVAANDSGPLQIQFRNTVYLGQFRFILDALFAVYEASSWELWSFMEYAAVNGGSRTPLTSPAFYLTLVLFLVVFVQQSIFLVVIIESFADLRSEEAFSSAPKPKNKPLIVLYEQPGLSDEKLRLRALKVHESATTFQKKLRRWYYQKVEKAFLVLVVLDAIVTSTKHLNQPPDLGMALLWFQVVVSVLFCLEVLGLFVFHLCYSDQYKLFFRSPYNWYLLVLAVGGLLAAVPQLSFPALAVFQALRLPRALRLFDAIKRFMFKTIGDGSRLLVVLVLTLVFLMWFSVVSMQFFGYLEPKPECVITGADQFSNVLLALESIFQLAMQEGWTQLMSEIMCHRDIAFAFMNLYFIGLHLFASLILLNFFVAVILDNLDYEEDEKKEKLEEDLKTKSTGEKVPLHLKVFKCCGQRRVRAPKISSVELPNLTEADVRNFYNTEDGVDYPSVPYHHERLPSIVEASFQHQSSDLSQLELLSEGRAELLQSGSSQRGKYWGVQGILSYVKAFRQHSRELENSRPLFGDVKSSGGPGTQLDSVQVAQSEYEEFREKYRLFDSALFCMPPEHRFRRACQLLLTKQLAPPTSAPVKNDHSNPLRDAFHTAASALRYVVSRLPYFSWLVVVVTSVTLALQISELHPSRYFVYYWLSDLFFVAITMADLLLKVLANGLFLNPHAALSTVWDLLDWLILLSTLATMLLYTTVCGAVDLSLPITFRNIPLWMEFLLVLRALRPLRLISLLPSMRRVISDVLLGWRDFGKAVVILFSFVFMFASLGVQLFTDANDSQSFCNDPSVRSPENCSGEFNIFLDLSRELLPSNQPELYMLVPRVWYPYRRDFRFDHIGTSLLTLFEVLTTEGWVDLRDMLNAPDGTSLNEGSSWLLKIYLHLFIFFGVNFGLQLFVGIVVNNFNEHKPDHSALLTVSQKRWTDLMHRIALARPIKLPPEPRHNGLRRYLYKIAVNRWYRHISSLFIFLNTWLLCAPWLDSTAELRKLSRVLISISLAFAAGFAVESVLKIVAFGRNYFQSFRNILDGLLSVLSLVYIVCAIAYLIDSSDITLNVVTDIALVLGALKFVTILTRYSTLQNLLTTVGTTILNSLSLLGVIGGFIITYAFVGVVVFSPLRSGEAINYSLVTFNGVWTSINLVIRVMTGEDWHQLLWDSMTQEPYCSQQFGNCGNVPLAILWFLSYYIFVPFILLNVVIAVLLENFSIFYNEDDTALSHAVVKDFKYNWKYFDSNASGSIPHSQIKLFLRMLKLQNLYTLHRNLESGLKERESCSLASDSLMLREMAEELLRECRQGGGGAGRGEGGGAEGKGELTPENLRHNFQSVLKMLAYRAEDISRRLVPQELYVREELEESVQFDVAEACILKWMQRLVKPVVVHQRKTRRKTIVQPPRRLKREETVIWAPNLGVAEEGEGWSDGGHVSCDTEDEGAGAGEPAPQEPLVARSFERLRNASYKHFDPSAAEDKWHGWFRMQQQWMEHVEEDSENYFDDFL